MLYCVVKSCFSLLKYNTNNTIEWGVQLGQLNINILRCTHYFLTCLRQRLDKYGHGSKKTHVFVSVFADWAAARAHSDSVPGLARSRRSWWLHWFPGFCGSGTIQAGGTGSSNGGALQVQMLFLCLRLLGLSNLVLLMWHFKSYTNIIAARGLDGQGFWLPWRPLCV